MTTEIVNGNNEDCDQWIDRRSQFGNPFKISDFNQHMPDEAARELVIDLYSNYFNKRLRYDPEFRAEVDKLKDKTLGCHCKPKACHGDVIKRYLDENAFFQGGRWWQGKQGYEKNKPELPDTVDCPECKTETAEQVDNDQLYKCTKCGRETVMIR